LLSLDSSTNSHWVRQTFTTWMFLLNAFRCTRFDMDPHWSETGDRYLLKLFRDYVFHQYDPEEHPVIDMAHVVQCLNKVIESSNYFCMYLFIFISWTLHQKSASCWLAATTSLVWLRPIAIYTLVLTTLFAI
jgi:hypothetical protein